MLLIRTTSGDRNMETSPLTVIAEVRYYVGDVFPSHRAADLEVRNEQGVLLNDSDVLGAARLVYVSLPAGAGG